MKYAYLFLTLILAVAAGAQPKSNSKNSEYRFTEIKNLEATPVKNQNRTSTCWSFSTLSFFESEMLRLGKGKDVDLSEMFVVRMVYPMKAHNFIRMHGRTNFGEGGGFPDVIHVLRQYGLVPEEVYTGKRDTSEPHNHKLLETTLTNILRPAASDDTRTIDFRFLSNSVNAICDEFLGKVPEQFTYKGKTYTPRSFAESTGLKADDYVFLTSFTHHPFYKPFVLEIPDNWNWQTTYNLPLEELQQVMSSAIDNGYTFAWGADVSEKTFLRADGLAVNPEKPFEQMTEEEKKSIGNKPHRQLAVTQDLRQKAFDNYDTQDDHGMHVIGKVKDQDNTPYYLVKNSWGPHSNQCDGYFYASESYVLYKTTSIMLHRKAIPAPIAKKLGL